jgi:DedD protein
VVPLAPRSSVVDISAEDDPPPSAATLDPGLKAWVVQVGSFGSRDNALRLVQTLRRAKLPTPDPDLVNVGGKRYYRVLVGPVVERRQAEQMRMKVSDVAGIKATIRRYPR